MNIEIRNLSKSFGEKIVLDGFSASFTVGKTSCIMAPSGAGKTTLIRLMLGLEKADKGEITGLEGLTVGAVFQDDRLCENLSAVSNIRLVNSKLGKREIIAELEKLGLNNCASQPVRELSGGMRRRVELLKAVLSDKQVLFLDEPFRGLDIETKAITAEYTRKSCVGRTVILVTHDKSEAQAVGAEKIIGK